MDKDLLTILGTITEEQWCAFIVIDFLAILVLTPILLWIKEGQE